MKTTSKYIAKIQAGLSPAQRLCQIVEHGMCVGCGVCESIAGSDTVRMELVENGFHRPVIKSDISHETVNEILQVCPATRVPALPEAELTPGTNKDPVWGAWLQLHLAFAAAPTVRHLGSTGGLLTALALHLLESGKVNFILHTRASTSHPALGESTISRTHEQVLQAAGSRYSPGLTLTKLHQVLDLGEPFAFIGKPCDVSALRNFAEIDSRVDDLCRYKLAMVCGGFKIPREVRAFLANHNIEEQEISSFRYRGYGCPGLTRVETRDGRVLEKTYLEYWGEDESTWALPLRCKICPDGIGDSADIAVADTWDGGSPDPGADWSQDLGTNAAITRTERGVDLMSGAASTGHVTIADNITTADLDRFQPHQVNKKLAAWARFAGLKSIGKVIPDTTGLDIESLARRSTMSQNLGQARGVKRRAAKGSENTS